LKELLIVDDSKVMRDMVVACLRGVPEARFTQVGSGLEAIERLSLGRFDLVVLDLNMPDISGIEVLEFVRAQDGLKALPIIVVTTRGDESSRTSAMVAGASQFMTKPFTPEAIVAEAQRLLNGGA
jgi:two-component system chemotaxis response regulator CheY